MTIAEQIQDELGNEWIPTIYEKKIRKQRTRLYELDVPQKENRTSILHTLLGVELKVGKKRFAAPDLSTARYLTIFARIGTSEFAIPYDISKISMVADELESSWQKMLLLIEKKSKGKTAQVKGRLRASVIRRMRVQIEDIGGGPVMPKFDTKTRQR